MVDLTEMIWRFFSIFGWPFVKRFALCYQTVVCLSCPVLSVCPVCNVGILWPNGWMDEDESWRAGRTRPWPHCVRWGLSSLSPKGTQPPPDFRPICCGQVAAWIKMPLGMELGDFLLDGDPALLSQKRGQSSPPQFSAHFYCGQTAACIKMPLVWR